MSENKDLEEKIAFFIDQRSFLIEELMRIDQNIKLFRAHYKAASLNKNNLYAGFLPEDWMYNGKQRNIVWIMRYRITKKEDNMRCYVIVEKGRTGLINDEIQMQFKKEVAEDAKRMSLVPETISLWPDAGFKPASKLLEVPEFDADSVAYKVVIDYYERLKEFNELVAKYIKQYGDQGYFGSR